MGYYASLGQEVPAMTVSVSPAVAGWPPAVNATFTTMNLINLLARVGIKTWPEVYAHLPFKAAAADWEVAFQPAMTPAKAGAVTSFQNAPQPYFIVREVRKLNGSPPPVPPVTIQPLGPPVIVPPPTTPPCPTPFHIFDPITKQCRYIPDAPPIRMRDEIGPIQLPPVPPPPLPPSITRETQVSFSVRNVREIPVPVVMEIEQPRPGEVVSGAITIAGSVSAKIVSGESSVDGAAQAGLQFGQRPPSGVVLSPMPPQLSTFSMPLDTTKLGEGQHTLKVKLIVQPFIQQVPVAPGSDKIVPDNRHEVERARATLSGLGDYRLGPPQVIEQSIGVPGAGTPGVVTPGIHQGAGLLGWLLLGGVAFLAFGGGKNALHL